VELRGHASDRGCGLARVELAVARDQGDDGCRYVGADGRLGPASRCDAATWLRATGTRHWKLVLKRGLPRGEYTARVQAIDRAGNVEPSRPGQGEDGRSVEFQVR
jgi:hypothetical protein